MPRDGNRAPGNLDVAVIGTGIAGLSAAWLLNERHRVTVYEARPRPGGHCNTVNADGFLGRVPVDTGFIVYNDVNYPNLVALFDRLGMATKPSDMSFAASLDGGRLEYAGTDLNGLLGQRRNALRPRFWRMVKDIGRFYREAPSDLATGALESLTLADYLASRGYSPAFMDDHLLPMGAAIWSTTAPEIRAYPAEAFVRFFASHGLLRLTGRPQWRTVEGGSRAYVRRLSEPFADRLRLGTPVRRVRRLNGRVAVEDRNGGCETYDHAVIATHADQALAMIADPDPEQRALLGTFRYTANRAFLHADPSLMPRERRVWASWNYIAGERTDAGRPLCVTYWMNRLQGIDARHPLFVTLNPPWAPRPETVIGAFDYDHPYFDFGALNAQKRLWRIQGRHRLWFCGSYFGYGFHEDALQSGLAAAEALGGVRRPWSVAAESERIALGPAADGVAA